MIRIQRPDDPLEAFPSTSRRLTLRNVRLFLSSPGDCHAERAATHGVATRLNADPVIASFARVEVVAWDWAAGVPLDALASPQVSVNKRLPVPEDCDVFVGIFRCRFGTPLPTTEFRRDDGTPFRSGSEYEFDRAWKARRRGAATPEVPMYRLDAAAGAACVPGEQLNLLNAFFDSRPFKDDQGWTGSVNRFIDTNDFEARLDGHLRRLLSQWHPSSRRPLSLWLDEHAKRVEHDAGPRYTRDSHLDADVSRVFDWLLARPEAVNAFNGALSAIWEELDDPGFGALKAELGRVADGLRADPRWLSPLAFAPIAGTLRTLAETAWELERAVEAAEAADPTSTSRDQYRRHQFAKAAALSRQAAQLLNEYAEFAQERVVLLTGPAGQGKTHTLVHEIRRTLASGGIGIGVLGQTLTATGDLRTALSQHWGYAESFAEFLDGLENAAAEKGQRALIAIDALNETPNRQRWKQELAGIIQDVLKRPHLALALSVRSDYRLHVLPELAGGSRPAWVEHEHTGFAGIEPEALLAYCRHYGVSAPVAPPIGELANPLYVQLLVKSLQGRPPPAHWVPSWLEVWAAWIDRLESDARSRFELDPSRSDPVRRTLSKLAAAMIDSGQFSLSRPAADEIARAIAGADGLVSFLCSAGALIDRLDGDDDVVEFGFERLSDTFFADWILDRLFHGQAGPMARRDALAAALSPGGSLRALAIPGHHTEPLTTRRSGLLQALCLAVPARARVELPELIAPEAADETGWIRTDWELREAFTDSLRWRCRPDEFAGDRRKLWRLFRKRGARLAWGAELDELIRLALNPGHPFAMAQGLHPVLLRCASPGARDAVWSVELVSLWSDATSNLSVLVRWASEAPLAGLHPEMAVPVAQLLAWTCATSQQGLREQATRGLTRVLVACPDAAAEIAGDFLSVNDDYVLESALVALWGLLIDGKDAQACAAVAKCVWKAIFDVAEPRCHLTIRHYARRIVEAALERGWIEGIDPARLTPPYRSTLPLSEVPTEAALRSADSSNGFRSIVGSALGRDFYWYVMGATSGGKPFSSQPLPSSTEPVRSYGDGAPVDGPRRASDIFDIPLAARFVVWNCHRLGWTADRFDAFDTGPHVRGASRMESPGRTERIGKKYQWISWQTMLAFLSDNYRMTPERLNVPRQYDTPHQIGYIEVLDPSRWLQLAPRPAAAAKDANFWRIPSLPRWPGLDDDDLLRWGASEAFDLPAIDVITHVPVLPETWGEGPWLRVAAEHVWTSPASPGVWGLGQERDADIWWQLTPAVIHSSDLPQLLEAIDRPDVRARLEGLGWIDLEGEWDVQLAEWPNLGGYFAEGPKRGDHGGRDAWLPVPWMFMSGKCGHPDRRDEHGPVILPWPRLFREWGLRLDLQHGVVRHGETALFGLAGWVLGEDALFARRDRLLELLDGSALSLVWWLRGERRAFVREVGKGEARAKVWIDSHGLAHLGREGRVNVSWIARVHRN